MPHVAAGGADVPRDRDRVRRAAAVLGVLALVQGARLVEHAVQVATQHGRVVPSGLPGRWLNLEWLNLLYNLVLAAALVWVVVRFRMWEPEWRHPVAGWLALAGALVFELGLRLPEHLARMQQYLAHGWNPAPGILGHTALHGNGPFDLLLLHLWYEAVLTGLLLVAFLAYRAASGRPERVVVLEEAAPPVEVSPYRPLRPAPPVALPPRPGLLPAFVARLAGEVPVEPVHDGLEPLHPVEGVAAP